MFKSHQLYSNSSNVTRKFLSNNNRSTFSPSIVTNGLVLYLDAGNTVSYPGSGTTWTDLSGNGNNATLFNSPTWSSSNGGTFTFNGINQYAACGAGFANLTSGITIFSIVNMGSANNYERIVDFGNGAPSDNFIFFRGGTTTDIGYFISNGATGRGEIRYTGGITNNAVANYTVTHDNSNVNFYKNGVLSSGPTSYPFTLTNITRNNCYIGRSNFAADAYFETTMSVIMIYNRALTEAEIQQNFNGLRGRFGL